MNIINAFSSCHRVNNKTSPVGIHPDNPSFYGAEYKFSNNFLESSPWISIDENYQRDERSIETDKFGWVKKLKTGQMVYTMCLIDRGAGGAFPAGPYKFSFSGKGTVSINGIVFTGQDLYLTNQDGFNITIIATDEIDYIKDIKLIMPGANGNELFHPKFISSFEGFNTLRFIYEGSKSWTKRAKPADIRYVYPDWENGMPWEVVVNLCNIVGANLYLNVPHMYSNKNIKSLIKLVHKKLNPELMLYIADSNETWNDFFRQYNYYVKRGLKRWPNEDPHTANLFYHYERTNLIGEIAKSYFGDRVICVLETNAFSDDIKVMLNEGRPGSNIDAVACAPYFGHNTSISDDKPKTLDELFVSVETEVQKVIDEVVDLSRYASSFGKFLISYEGGQHLTNYGNDPLWGQLIVEANRDSRMGTMYSLFLNEWKQIENVRLFMHMNNTVHNESVQGYWGLQEHYEQDRKDAPKKDAILTFIEGNEL